MRWPSRPCPVCATDAPLQPVYKHRWICCPACGNASRLSRERLLVDALPDGLRDRLPAALGWRLAPDAGTEDHWFRSPPSARDQWEADEVEARLARLGIPPVGDVLDIGGGTGAVAARLGGLARRVVLLEHASRARARARELGVDARPFDFDGLALPDAVDGRFNLILCRFALGFCRSLPRFAAGLSAVAAPDAALILTFVTPSRGALLTSALEDHAPRVLWSPAHVGRVLAEAGWLLTRRFEALPPMPFTVPHRPGFGALSLPWLLWPGPLALDPLQRHAGLVLRYVGEQPARP